jgi:hypothetical protein
MQGLEMLPAWHSGRQVHVLPLVVVSDAHYATHANLPREDSANPHTLGSGPDVSVAPLLQLH